MLYCRILNSDVWFINMASAKGTFPGKPRKKLHKQSIKYQQTVQKRDSSDLRLLCNFINDVSRLFHEVFDGDSDQVSFLTA